MTKSQINYINPEQQQQQLQDYSEMEDFTDEEFNSEDSEEDPSYTYEFNNAQSNFSKLSINKRSNLRDDEEREVDDAAMSSQKLCKEDMKNIEHVQKTIDCGQIEKLKVDQCKVYLRNYGLRLTGKKDILIQRIKEHLEILNGGGEKKYPPSSFVLNCKGDACLGDVVMFEQTVYEGYNIVSRSASAPPCGKRTIAGRIVNESYGAAKQQHTFTIEVLWSNGEKPLPPLHPLLIKGRNLYKLNTRRQRWNDEAERQRVLNEKHSRGTVARSTREARIQEKMTRKSLKGTSRVNPKNKENPMGSKRSTKQITSLDLEKLGGNAEHQVQSKVPPFHFHEGPRSQVILDHGAQSSHSTHGYQTYVEYKGDPRLPVSRPPSYQQKRSSIQYNQDRRSYLYEKENLMTSSWGNYPHCPSDRLHDTNTTLPSNINERNPQRTVLSANCQRQQLCHFYPQGRCHYGNQCKFLHVTSRNFC